MMDTLSALVESVPWLRDEGVQLALAGLAVAVFGWLIGRRVAGRRARAGARVGLDRPGCRARGRAGAG